MNLNSKEYLLVKEVILSNPDISVGDIGRLILLKRKNVPINFDQCT